MQNIVSQIKEKQKGFAKLFIFLVFSFCLDVHSQIGSIDNVNLAKQISALCANTREK